MIVKSGITTKVYRFAIRYAIKHSEFPTLDEVAAEFKCSRERARQRMERLCKLGFIKKKGKALHRAYTFRIVDLPKVDKTILKKIKVANSKIKNHKNATRNNKNTKRTAGKL